MPIKSFASRNQYRVETGKIPNPTLGFVPMKLIKRISGILAAAFLMACGGNGMRATGRDAGQGGSGVSRSGAGGIVGTGGISANLSGDMSQGGVPSQGGSPGSDIGATVVDTVFEICGCGSSSDSSCDQSKLWDEVAYSASLVFHDVYCGEIPDPGPDGGIYDGGYVVLDGEGRVIDNTIFGSADSRRQAWLDSLADYRWPCLAGERIPFACGWSVF
jgi:hypothetical protein